MNTTSSLKVTVNGKKYLITGIQKETSCKDLLCAIAKVTKTPLTVIKDTRSIGEEKSFRAIYGVKTNELKGEENLLEKFKGDRKQVGDFESLKVFNSLGKNAKIVVKETVAKKEIDEHVHKKHKKKVRIKEDRTIKKQDTEKKCSSSKQKNKKNTEKQLLHTFESNIKPKKHRSVDDSDIDSYKNDTLSRIKKRRSRVHDDSDIDLYKNLFHVVLDQTKTLNKLQTQSKEVRKTAWIKELQKSSQVYHFLDEEIINESSKSTIQMNKALEKDDGNDSGLPSPEYDSSESQENHPIKKNDIRSRVILNNNEESKFNQTIDNRLKQNIFKDKQKFISNQNKDCDSLQNNITEQSVNTQNIFEQKKETRTKHESKQDLAKFKNNNLKDFSKNIIRDDLTRQEEESENLMYSVPLVTEKSLLTKTVVENINSNNKMLVDHNKNVILTNVVEEEASRKMVAFNVALSQQKYLENTSKKVDKKKIKKTDISDPLLLSPSTFKRHRSLKKAELILGVEVGKADVFKKSQPRMVVNGVEKETEKKEKEKFYNKKLKEIRSKKTKKTTKSEPEYSTKFYFEESIETNLQSHEVEEILELNVFEKKNKNKLKNNKKSKTYEAKSKQNGLESKNETIYTNNDTKTKEREKLKSSSKFEKTNKSIEDGISNHNNNNNNNVSNQKSSDVDITQNTITNENKANSVELRLNIENDRVRTSSSERNENITDKYKNLKVIDENNTPLQITCEDTKTTEQNKSINNNYNTQIKTEHATVAKISDINSQSFMSNTQTSIDDSIASNGNQSESETFDEQQKTAMILEFQREQKHLNELIERILDYNLLMRQLAEELEILSNSENFTQSDEDLEKEEQKIHAEIENVKSLLRSVVDLTNYQRREMSENLAMLDQLDSDVRTRKAGYENLKNGVWKTSSQSAP